jgi:hypothetical protein
MSFLHVYWCGHACLALRSLSEEQSNDVLHMSEVQQTLEHLEHVDT